MYRLYGLYRCIEREETAARSPKKTASVRLFGHIQCIVYIVCVYIYTRRYQANLKGHIYIDSRERNQKNDEINTYNSTSHSVDDERYATFYFFRGLRFQRLFLIEITH
jgi:hypothetical protein